MTKDVLLQRLTQFYKSFCKLHNCKDNEVTPAWYEQQSDNKCPHIQATSDKYMIEIRPVFSDVELDILDRSKNTLYVVNFTNHRYDPETTEGLDCSIDDWRISQFRIDGVKGAIEWEIKLLRHWISKILH